MAQAVRARVPRRRQERGLKVENNFLVPVPEEEQSLLKNPSCNFSLYFPRMVSWNLEKDELKPDTEAMPKLQKKSASSFQSLEVKDGLSEKHRREDAYLESLKKSGVQTFSFIAKTSSPFVTGLGSGHPTETGMVLDRNLGVPYLPASSIKGVLRLAYAVNIANGRSEVPDAELDEYFGSTDTEKGARGRLLFLDAYPKGNVGLKVDIMNPHFGKYYDGTNKQPVETESPVPIKFLTVKEGTEFVFSCAYLPFDEDDGKDKNAEKIKADVESMFKTAFTRIGFGGKTSTGYGRFRIAGENQTGTKTDSQSSADKTAEFAKGEYEAIIFDTDKNRATFYFEVKKQKCVLRNCKPRDFQIFHKKDKVKITLDGTKDKNGFYVATKVEKIKP